MSDPYSPLGPRLEELLPADQFVPPAEFAARAKVRDPAIFDQAAGDPAAWWARQARERLHWDTPFSSVLDDSNAPFYTWFADGTINASYNCLDRHVLAGQGDQIGKLARPSRIIWADDLPKTRSGKIMRRLLRDIAEDREPGDVTTLRDPAVLAQLQHSAHAGH
jgi:acyl-CoA synthetase (AMP-forming)/AMP-acid ligase II